MSDNEDLKIRNECVKMEPDEEFREEEKTKKMLLPRGRPKKNKGKRIVLIQSKDDMLSDEDLILKLNVSDSDMTLAHIPPNEKNFDRTSFIASNKLWNSLSLCIKLDPPFKIQDHP